MSKKITDLTTLIPDQTFDTSAGKITLRPFPFRLTNQALDIISKYKTIFLAPKQITYKDEDGVDQTTFASKDTVDIVDEILAKNDDNYSVLEDIAQLLLISGKEDISKIIPELGYQEVVYLLSIVVKLNQDFFGQIKSLFAPPEEALGVSAQSNAEKPQAPTGETGLAA
jgi:ABC-type antimicrobial peptide transport system permease subunit